MSVIFWVGFRAYERSGIFSGFSEGKIKGHPTLRISKLFLSQFYFLKDKIKILDDFKDDESIIIVKPDKKNGVVILDKNDYNSKMEDILQDTTKFEHLMDARKPTQKITDNVKRNLNKNNIPLHRELFL